MMIVYFKSSKVSGNLVQKQPFLLKVPKSNLVKFENVVFSLE